MAEEKIFKAISSIMEDIGIIAKEKKSQQGFLYRGIDDVMNTLHPLLAKHHVFVVPEILEQRREERVTNKGGNLLFSICKIKYTFFADDGSNIYAIVIGEGMDTGDKSTNKAMSIAFKYALFQVFCIPTEEMSDSDQESPTPNKNGKSFSKLLEEELTRQGISIVEYAKEHNLNSKTPQEIFEKHYNEILKK